MSHSDLNNQEKLEAIYQMTLDNHEVLKTIRRQQYFANTLRVVYWLVVIGVLGGAYYFVKPIIATFTDNSGKIEEAYTQLRNQLPETKIFNQVMDNLKTKNDMVGDSQMIDDGVIDASSTINQ